MRYVLSRKVGDGATPETAFRPALADMNHGSYFDLGNGFFLCAVEEPSRISTRDIEVNDANIDRLRTSGHLTRTMGTRAELVRDMIEQAVPRYKAREIRLGNLRLARRKSLVSVR